MALLFQSNPDQWDLRGHMEPGKFISWFVSRYQAFMYAGALVLLWEAKGEKPKEVKGLYGWGITTDEVKPDNQGRLRIRLQYVERWVSKLDKDNERKDEHIAPIPADDVLSLGTWQKHLLNVMPVGTNFLVTPEQLQELNDLVRARFPKSQFYKAVALDLKGERLDPGTFTVRDPIIEGEE